MKAQNVFDNLPSLAAPSRKELRDEIDRYLSTDPEKVDNVLLWWYEHRAVYPCLSRMALDYLTIPGKSDPFNKYARFDHNSDLPQPRP